MVSVARNAVGTTIGAVGFVVGAGLVAARKISETAANIANRGQQAVNRASDFARSKVQKAADSVEENAYEAAEWADEKAESALDTAADVGEKIADKLEDPDYRPYEERTVEELYELAAERDIYGRSTMNKAELIAALRESN